MWQSQVCIFLFLWFLAILHCVVQSSGVIIYLSKTGKYEPIINSSALAVGIGRRVLVGSW